MCQKSSCSIKLLPYLTNILKTNEDLKDEKLEAIQISLDGIKMSGHATQSLLSKNQILFLPDVSSEYKNLAKFAEYTNSNLFGEE